MSVNLVEGMDEVLKIALAGPLPVAPPPAPDDDLKSDLHTRH